MYTDERTKEVQIMQANQTGFDVSLTLMLILFVGAIVALMVAVI